MKKQITKSYLEYLGVTEVTRDGKIFTKNGELKPCAVDKRGSLSVILYDSEKYKSTPKEKRNNNSGKVNILVYHVVFAWFNGEVPYGKEIHHKDGNYLNNAIDNLVALTRAEHAAEHKKLRALEATTEEKCRLDIPREHYVKKIAQYEFEGKGPAACQYKRRLRYWDNHHAEYEKLQSIKKDLEIIKYLKKEYKKSGHLAQWHQYRELEKHWFEYDDNIKEQIMNCILKKGPWN